MMPSEPASAKPCSAALRVCDDETLMAGNAKAPAFAASSISAYFSGVAMGIRACSSGLTSVGLTLVAVPKGRTIRPSGQTRARAANWHRVDDNRFAARSVLGA